MRGNPSYSAPSIAGAARALLRKLVKPLLDERDGQVVRDQFAAIVDGLNLLPEFRVRL